MNYTGRIIKATAGFYYVWTKRQNATSDDCPLTPPKHADAPQLTGNDGRIYACRAKGIFRKKEQSPLVGDIVDFDLTDDIDMEGFITDIHPRRNSLKRPPVANIDQALVIFSIHRPDINHNLLTKYLVMLEYRDISPILVFQKSDLTTEEEEKEILSIYSPTGYPVCFVSAKEETGIDEVKKLLTGRTTTVAGPSGAGKSSLINTLLGRRLLETQKVSDKTGRGRQTTRVTELIHLSGDTFLFDTPGFSSIDSGISDERELSALFPEFRKPSENCRFTGCAHIHEPGCGVKQALKEGHISQQRYDDYVLIYNEIKDSRPY